MKWTAYLAVAFLIAIGASWMALRLDASPPAPACVPLDYDGASFTGCTYDPARHDLRLLLLGPDGTPLGDLAALRRALGDDADRVVFAMNAGMFGPDQFPVGLYVERGEQRRALNRNDGPGNFHMKPNGVFWTDRAGAPHIQSTDAFIGAESAPWFATQSGPLLLDGGERHDGIAEDGPSRNIRNGVALCRGRAVFAVSHGAVSFGKLTRLFSDELGCDHALYLDGAVSVLWAPELGRMDGGAGLGPFVVVLRR